MNDNLSLTNTSRFRHFDWEKAKTFYYISKMGSFTKSAEFLRTSQPALSRQISSLERQLGCPLFIRQSRGVALTRKGEELIKIIEEPFQQMKEFTHTAKKIERGQKRTLRIGIEKGIMLLIVEALEAYQRSHPYLTFELTDDYFSKDMPLLDLDIAFRPYNVNYAHYLQKRFIQLDKKLLFNSPLTINSDIMPEELIDLFFVTPDYLKDDEEIEDIYQTLLSSVTGVRKAETIQREAA